MRNGKKGWNEGGNIRDGFSISLSRFHSPEVKTGPATKIEEFWKPDATGKKEEWKN